MTAQSKLLVLSTLFIMTSMLLTGCGGDSNDQSAPNSTLSVPQANLTQMERGQIIFRRCHSCHTLGSKEKHKVGPNLHGLFGSVAGTKTDFNYSKAMGASDVIWTEETLNKFLIRPSDFMPGNRMSFIGLNKAEDRAAVITYLKSETNK